MTILELIELRETLHQAYLNGILTVGTFTLAAGEIGANITALSAL